MRFWGVFLLVASTVAAQVPGLIDQPQTFPWSVGLAPVAQEEAGGLDAGSFRLKSSVLWFNLYRQYGLDEAMAQQLDMEGWIQTVSVAWSPKPGWELRAQAQGWILGTGILDAFLSGFHGTLYFPNQGRDQVADGHYRDYLKGEFDLRSPGMGLTQTSLGIRAFSGPWSWSAWVKPPVPAPRDWGWSDRWSAGSGVGWGDRWTWFSGLVGAGVSAAAVVADREPSFDGATGGICPQWGGYLTMESPWGPRAMVQGSWTRVPREGPAYLSQGAGLLTSGVQVPFDRSFVGEVALTEEFFTWATMEVGFQVGFTWIP